MAPLALVAWLVATIGAGEQQQQCDDVGSAWGPLRSQLGVFQPPRRRAGDYSSFAAVESPSLHFHRRGVALDGEGRAAEALAAFEKAVDIDPSDGAHWNNVGVAVLRQPRAAGSSSAAALSSLEQALRRVPENRLTVGNHQLATAVAGLDDGDTLVSTRELGQPQAWCVDNDGAVSQLSKGRYSECAAAAAAASHFDTGERGAAAARAVCTVCPAACNLCPASDTWLAQWWEGGGGSAPDSSTSSTSSSTTTTAGDPLYGAESDSCSIDRRSAASLTPAAFAKEYSARRVPVMISGMAEHWPMQHWLRQHETDDSSGSSGSRTLAANEAQTMGTWLRDSLHGADKLARNQYLNLDKASVSDAGGMPLGVLPLLRAVAAVGYVPSPLFTGQGDLLRRACFADLPRRWLLISGRDTGSSWHVDPLNTSAWNTLLVGRKRWALLPPDQVPDGADLGAAAPGDGQSRGMEGYDYFNRSTAWGAEMGWWGTTAPWRDSSGSSAQQTFERLRASNQQPLECVQHPNETLFVPSGWWHTTINLRPSLAVTENFAARDSNLEEVLRELGKRPDRTPDGGQTATDHCDGALRWLAAAEDAANARKTKTHADAATVTRYPGTTPSALDGSKLTWEAAVRFGEGAPPMHLILFLAPKRDSSGAQRRATAALRTAARRAVVDGPLSAEAVQVVEVQPNGGATKDLMRQFEVESGNARPVVRVATLGPTLFRHAPPEKVTLALAKCAESEEAALVDELTEALGGWVGDVESGASSPYLTAADRKVLLSLMAHDKK